MRFYKLDKKDEHIYSCWDEEEVKYSWVIWFSILSHRKELGLELIQSDDALLDLENGLRAIAINEGFYKSEGYKMLQRIYNSWSNFAPASIEFNEKLKAGEEDEVRGFAFAVRTIIVTDTDFVKKHKKQLEKLINMRYEEVRKVNDIFHEWKEYAEKSP